MSFYFKIYLRLSKSIFVNLTVNHDVNETIQAEWATCISEILISSQLRTKTL